MKPITQQWLNRAKDDLDVVVEIINIAHLTNITALRVYDNVKELLTSKQAGSDQ